MVPNMKRRIESVKSRIRRIKSRIRKFKARVKRIKSQLKKVKNSLGFLAPLKDPQTLVWVIIGGLVMYGLIAQYLGWV